MDRQGGPRRPPWRRGNRTHQSDFGEGKPERNQERSHSTTARGRHTLRERRGTRGQGFSRGNHYGREHSVDSRENSSRFCHTSRKLQSETDNKNRICLKKSSDDEVTRKRLIGYKKLESWASESNAGQLVLTIFNEIDALNELLNGSSIKPDWYMLMVNVCRNIVTVQHQTQALKKILTVLISSHFLGHHLFSFVSKKKESEWREAEDFINDILVILKEVMNKLPEFASKCEMPLELLKPMVAAVGAENEELLQAIKDLQQNLNRIELKKNAYSKSSCRQMPFSYSDTPPEDFRQLSVIPESSDLCEEAEPFVRAVLSKGAYKDEADYLDIQFRLIREDFIQPLRNGINEFKVKGCKKDFKSSDLRFYFDVQIIGMTTVKGIKHVLQFDMKQLKTVNWENSKRFMNGSLLCLSKDNFETFFFAVVTFRNPKDLKEGIINVEFKTRLQDILCCPSTDIFIMAETIAYFEAYKPILEGLKEVDCCGRSLQKYFIFSQNKTIRPPDYLLGGVKKIDLSNLMLMGEPTIVPVLTTVYWPPVENMKVNESQKEAIQLALTKELAIIQGPPGTGKTYVGLNVMEILLKNQNKMFCSEGSSPSPILVLCFTNHALDQFLEGVYEFCPKGLVRVGGRSSSDIMEELNLKNMRKKRVLPRSERAAFYTSRENLNFISEQIAGMKDIIDSLNTSVQKERTLEKYILPHHYSQLWIQPDDNFASSKATPLKKWLNASKTLNKETLPLLIKSRMTKLALQIHFFSDLNEYTNNYDVMLLNKILASMKVLQRVSIYQSWLHNLISLKNFNRDRHLIIKSKREILKDFEIEPVIPKIVFECLKSMNENDGKNFDCAIEKWVLGANKSLTDQLNDVEILFNALDQSEVEKGDFDGAEDGLSSPSDRLVETDHNEEEEISKATMKVKEGNAYLLIKAERLGIGEETEDQHTNEWQTVTHKRPLSFKKLRYYLTEIEPMTHDEESRVNDLWDLDIKKRFALYNYWIKKHRNEVADKINNLAHKYEEAVAGLQEIRMQGDIEILKHAKVIGMTTTGAAKYRAMLQAVGCQIVIVEEAAEVLEAHIVTSLSKNCKHLILIGDHQQLKPNPTVYTLAKDYHLDLSLFERLINNGIEHVTLKEQHRMRPAISKIMRHIYPKLEDHISVTKFDNVRGVAKNIFFINHTERETDVNDSKSKSNAHEASYLIALFKYLLLQRYNASEITILATYIGQVFMLRKELKAIRMGDSVRITTVDNYQGEENDIILLSLVRSNERSNVGFLKVDNRVCVALSRAKKGFFAIGNFEMLASNSKLWTAIVETAKMDNIYGDGLLVSCPNHLTPQIEIKFADEFQANCPEGGCLKPCEFRLQCGHTCPLKCHGYDTAHTNIRCVKMCARSCSIGHPCNKKCSQNCGDCYIKVQKIIPRCGHTDNVFCYIAPESAECSQRCGSVLSCDHQCSGKCGDCNKNGVHSKCMELVNYCFPCDHTCKVECYKKPSELSCPQKCDSVLLNCGHKCGGTCSQCINSTMHIACQQKCNYTLPCSHKCTSLCSVPCPPCSKVCEDFCQHSKCGTDTKGHACRDKCIPCLEPCMYKCKHKQCTKKCSEHCDIEPCEEKCRNVLKCKHKCNGLCGELCVCEKCNTISTIKSQNTPDSNKLEQNSSKLGESETGSGKNRTAESVENKLEEKSGEGKTKEMTKSRNEEPEQNFVPLIIMIPGCKHIFHVKELDSYVESFKMNYNIYYIPCPKCNKKIQNCFRYNKIIKTKVSQREAAKTILRNINEVTKSERRALQESLYELQGIDFDMIWTAMTNTKIDALSTQNQVQSLNLKCKYAYILSDMLLLEKQRMCGESEVVQSRIEAVKKLDLDLTPQQKSEFTKGLYHLLMKIYFETLNESKFYSTHLETVFQETKLALKEKEISMTDLKKIQSDIRTFEDYLKKIDNWNMTAVATKKTMATDLKILNTEQHVVSSVLFSTYFKKLLFSFS